MADNVSTPKTCRNNLYFFVFIFCICWILQNMFRTFLTSSVQSIERHFQIPSSKSGTLISASRVGFIPSVLLLAYFGNKGNRARWIGAGSLIVAVCCFLAASPNFIFPPKPVYSIVDDKFILESMFQTVLNTTPVGLILANPTFSQLIPHPLQALLKKYDNLEDLDTNFHSIRIDEFFSDNPLKKGNFSTKCLSNGCNFKSELVNNMLPYFTSNLSRNLMKKAELQFGYCEPSVMKLKSALKEETCRRRKETVNYNEVAFALLFIAIAMYGLGESMPNTLGMPLLDDNVKRENAPFLFAVVRSVRLLGPMSGMWLGAGCFGLYVTLQTPVGLTPADPRWIGAWWLGFLIIGVLLFVPSAMMFWFSTLDVKRKVSTVVEPVRQKSLNEPQNVIEPLLSVRKRSIEVLHQISTKLRIVDEIKHFAYSIALCLKSPVYIGMLFSRLFVTFAFRGVWAFLPKYIENHYGAPQHQVSLISGVFFSLAYGAGVFVGGLVMKRFKLNGRRAAMYILICEILSMVFAMAKISLKCKSVNNSIGQLAAESNFNLTSTCNQNCFCDKYNLFPVCSENGTQYFSPCYAGCSDFTNDMQSFSNCSCSDGGMVSRDFCTSDCTVPMYMYYALTTLTELIEGTFGVPAMILTLRSVPEEVRSVSTAFTAFLVSLLSVAPSTIVVGSIIDGTCLLWNSSCGKRGACLLYDPDALRIRIHSMYGIMRSIGFLFNVWVWYWAADVVLLKKKETPSAK